MNAIKMAAMVLVVGGFLGLLYGSFSYTRETQEAKFGPIELSIADKQTVKVPIWLSVGALLAGGGLLIFATKKN
ncbi:MAG: hypothetical protein EHM86_01455 [Desulfobulbaceae bacterium]|nr:MAG: hypothetical protein EHM86_01455 [Desulfobulbaceae bacterium]